MRRSLHRLSAKAIERAKEAGYLSDGGGLYLQVTASGACSWIFRFDMAKRRREMGLGPFPDVSLATARKLAGEARALVKGGQDPIEARDAERLRQRLEASRGVKWEEAVSQFLDAHETTWRNPKHRQQWRNTLETYGTPVLGGLSVAAIGTPEVTRVLDPIWHEKPETASRVRNRIERILDWSKVRGYRTGENPARWRGHLEMVFPARGKVRKVRHHPAVSIDGLPAVYARLKGAEGMAAKAQRFTILTAARGGQTTGARWPEIDRQAATWTIPGSRMKSGNPHRVPLSAEAMAIVEEMAELRTKASGYVFPGQRTGKPLSLTGLAKALRVAGGGDATTHGGRSTFKDWATERTTFPAEVSEMALAHVVGDKTEAAYRRGELLEKRRAIMDQWARFLRTPTPSKVVVPIGRKRA